MVAWIPGVTQNSHPHGSAPLEINKIMFCGRHLLRSVCTNTHLGITQTNKCQKSFISSEISTHSLVLEIKVAPLEQGKPWLLQKQQCVKSSTGLLTRVHLLLHYCEVWFWLQCNISEFPNWYGYWSKYLRHVEHFYFLWKHS